MSTRWEQPKSRGSSGQVEAAHSFLSSNFSRLQLDPGSGTGSFRCGAPSTALPHWHLSHLTPPLSSPHSTSSLDQAFKSCRALYPVSHSSHLVLCASAHAIRPPPPETRAAAFSRRHSCEAVPESSQGDRGRGLGGRRQGAQTERAPQEPQHSPSRPSTHRGPSTPRQPARQGGCTHCTLHALLCP